MEERGDMGEAVRMALRSRLPAGVTLRFPPEDTWRIRQQRGTCRVLGEAWAAGGGEQLHIRFCAVARHSPAGWQVLRVDMVTGLAERES